MKRLAIINILIAGMTFLAWIVFLFDKSFWAQFLVGLTLGWTVGTMIGYNLIELRRIREQELYFKKLKENLWKKTKDISLPRI